MNAVIVVGDEDAPSFLCFFAGRPGNVIGFILDDHDQVVVRRQVLRCTTSCRWALRSRSREN
jgi:hypothetical protein